MTNVRTGFVIYDPFDGTCIDEEAAWGAPEQAEVFATREAADEALAEVHVIYPECVVITREEAMADDTEEADANDVGEDAQ